MRLNQQLTGELLHAVEALDRDPGVGCIVITGSEKAFAAGADIKEMQDRSYMDMYSSDWFSAWDRLVAVRTPIIAAVAGFALGGGCELAMMCDIILAADTAKFGLPGDQARRDARDGRHAAPHPHCGQGQGDGDVPDRPHDGRGGSRTLRTRLPRGARRGALGRGLKTAETIASMSLPIAMMAKETINRSYETTLAEGIRFERRVFHAMFATADQKEGMGAFVDKRKPEFKHC